MRCGDPQRADGRYAQALVDDLWKCLWECADALFTRTDAAYAPQVEPVPVVHLLLVCEECGAAAEGAERGWRAYLCDVDDDGQDEILTYCPWCALNAFGD